MKRVLLEECYFNYTTILDNGPMIPWASSFVFRVISYKRLIYISIVNGIYTLVGGMIYGPLGVIIGPLIGIV